MKEEQTVFVVDDEPAVTKALSRLFKSSGYRTRAFGSAQEFMDQYTSGAAGCLVLDISMPGMTGLDLQRWLAASGGTLPILFLTALDDSPEKSRAMKEGAMDVLMKPVSPNALLRRVEEALALDREARKE
jgi:FixJ family two-component response regulator